MKARKKYIYSCHRTQHLDCLESHEGSQGVVKIGDFGMAALQGTEIDGEGDARYKEYLDIVSFSISFGFDRPCAMNVFVLFCAIKCFCSIVLLHLHTLPFITLNRYMAAELLNVLRTNSARVVMPPADVFSLGLTLYEMCRIGQVDSCFVTPPLEGPQWHVLRNGQAERVRNRPPDLEEAIALAMSPDPRSRPTTESLLTLGSLEGVVDLTDEILMSAQPTTVSKIFPHHAALGLSLSCPSGDIFQNMPLDHVLTPTASAFSLSSISSTMYSTLGSSSVLSQPVTGWKVPSSASASSQDRHHSSHCFSTVTSMESVSQPNSVSRELHTSDDKSISFDQSSDIHPGIDSQNFLASTLNFKLARNNKEIVRKRLASSPIDIANSLSSCTASESSPLVFQSHDYRRKISMFNNDRHHEDVNDLSCEDPAA